jgi:uncharacterized membrane protein
MGQPTDQDVELNTQRIEAFSDGVFAIAITLLILEIKVPHLNGSSDGKTLAQTLVELWPSYFAYLLSFLMIGIYWANHHYIFKLYQKTDHLFNLLNVFFLLCISFLPFPTAVLGEYVDNPQEQHTAVRLYALGLLLPAFSWLLMWLYASYNYRLIDKRLDKKFVGYLSKQYNFSMLLYLAALLVSFRSVKTCLAMCVGLTLLYLLPPKRPVYQKKQWKEE